MNFRGEEVKELKMMDKFPDRKHEELVGGPNNP